MFIQMIGIWPMCIKQYDTLFQYDTDFYVLDKYPLAVRPFYTMPDPNNPVSVLKANRCKYVTFYSKAAWFTTNPTCSSCRNTPTRMTCS